MPCKPKPPILTLAVCPGSFFPKCASKKLVEALLKNANFIVECSRCCLNHKFRNVTLPFDRLLHRNVHTVRACGTCSKINFPHSPYLITVFWRWRFVIGASTLCYIVFQSEDVFWLWEEWGESKENRELTQQQRQRKCLLKINILEMVTILRLLLLLASFVVDRARCKGSVGVNIENERFIIVSKLSLKP